MKVVFPSLILLLFVSTKAVPAGHVGDQAPAVKGIDHETVDAFRKIGARFESGIEPKEPSFRGRHPVAIDLPNLPGFRFRSCTF